MSALSELLQQRNREELTPRAISTRARAAGYSLSPDTAWKYLTGRHGTPTDAALEALAAVLPVKLRDLQRAAGIVTEDLGPYVPPDEASRLGRRERAAVDEIVRLLARSHGSANNIVSLPAAALRANGDDPMNPDE